MPEKLYTTSNMGGGLQVINSADPVNPQDLVTKRYVDSHNGQFGRYTPLWETNYKMQSGAANYSAGTTHLTVGPNDRTITKLYPDTAIRIIGSMSGYINANGSQILLQCSVNGGTVTTVTGLWMGALGEHTSLPLGLIYILPASMGGAVSGAMTVAWWMTLTAGPTVLSTDSNDFASWTIAECKVS